MNFVWIGIIILILIIIAVIITIVVFNRGNDIDIISQLPQYKIFYPESKGYLQLLNMHENLPPPIPVSNPFWEAVTVVNNSDTLNIWAFDDNNISSSFSVLPKGSKYVKLINVIYNETGYGYIPQAPPKPPTPTISKLGYIQRFLKNIDGSNSVRLLPIAGPTNATVFIYTDLGNNQFTLTIASDTIRGVSMDKNNIPFIGLIANYPLAKFQLTLI